MHITSIFQLLENVHPFLPNFFISHFHLSIFPGAFFENSNEYIGPVVEGKKYSKISSKKALEVRLKVIEKVFLVFKFSPKLFF